MGEAIAITSGKGGVGKSSVCINMGMVLAQKGYRVCLIDVETWMLCWAWKTV